MPKLLKHLSENHPSLPVPLARPANFRKAVLLALIALACLVVASAVGGVNSDHLRDRIAAIAASVLFFFIALLATRSVSSELYRVVAARGGVAAASVVRLLISAVGYILTTVVVMGMLGLPIEHLLVGGAITGVVLGIAAQQSLSNVFAGLVLMLARPFSPGDHIRIRSGSLGGELDGSVEAMGLTYVSVHTALGLLHIPNSTMMASGVGPWTPPPPAVVTPPPAPIGEN